MMKQLPIRERKKSPSVKMASWKPQQFPCQGREKGFDIQALYPWQNCYTRTEDMGHVGEKQELIISKTLALSHNSSDPARSLKSSLFFSSSLHIWTMGMVQNLGCKCSHMLDTSQHLLLKNNCTMTVLKGGKSLLWSHCFVFFLKR